MRPIKFRAWLKNCQRMVNIEEINFLEGYIVWIDNDYNNQEQIKEVDKFEDIILMQSTGLKDRDGVEIYEGDVLRNVDNPIVDKLPFEVVWDEYHGAWFWRDEVGTDYFCQFIASNSEIFGNILDNPELMVVER